MSVLIRIDWRPLAAAVFIVLGVSGCVAGQGAADPTPLGHAMTDAVATSVATTAASTLPAATAAPTEGATAVPTEGATAAPTNTEVPVPAPRATAPASAAASATPPPAPTVTPVPATEPPSAITPRRAAPDLSQLRLALTPVASGLTDPLYLTHAGDGSGRRFVVEKTGVIRIIADGKVLGQPLLDISDRVRSSGSEQGLLGLAFPPNYATHRFFFVNYTNASGNTVISRFNVTGDPDVAEPASESLVLTFAQPAANHNGGALVFGPDGYLWIGTGDGGGANDRYGNGQNPDVLLAKMLRIDVLSDSSVPYTVPRDNPAYGQQWKVRPEIWAIGLRNPWRYSFDRQTGDLWIADVGQNRIEEIDVVRAGSPGGLNFGWPVMEGPNCFQKADCDRNGLVLPVARYEHGADGCSVTGGYVYRGERFPALQGVYLYGDYCTGRIWGLDAADPGQPKLLLETGPGLSSFGQDEAGELYITSLSSGTVRQIAVR